MIYVTGDTHREFSRFSRLDLTKDDIVIVNLSGRGDKDVNTIANYINERGGL